MRQDNTDGLYYEGSISGGRLDSDYHGTSLGTSYDTNSFYYAFHVGLGRIVQIDKKNRLDTYGKYFFAHQGGDTAKLSTGESYDFAGINTQRLRLGARITDAYSDRASFYYGAAYEYTFGGDARASYSGYSTPSPSLRGGSALLELGWQIQPGNHAPALDLSLSGWAGKKQGMSLNLGAQWAL